LVPANGFSEWAALETGVGAERGRKVPKLLAGHGEELPMMAFGAIWEKGTSGHDAGAQATGSIADLHDRMPVIVPPEARGAWLSTTDAGGAAASASSSSLRELKALAALQRVNVVKNDERQRCRHTKADLRVSPQSSDFPERTLPIAT